MSEQPPLVSVGSVYLLWYTYLDDRHHCRRDLVDVHATLAAAKLHAEGLARERPLALTKTVPPWEDGAVTDVDGRQRAWCKLHWELEHGYEVEERDLYAEREVQE